jgi:hypothetical protein
MPVPRLAGLPSSFESDVRLRAVSADSRPRTLSPEPPSPNPEPLSAVVARFNLAIREQDWDSMRACCTDDAIIDSVTANAPLGADETVAAVRAAYRAGVYHVQEWQNEDLADGVVLSSGRVQYRPEPGHMSDSMFHWITTGRDGRMWRVKAFPDRDDALAYLELHGPTLGL